MEQNKFVAHGVYTVSNAGGYEIMMSDCGSMAKVRDAFGSDNPQTSDWLDIESILICGNYEDKEEFYSVIDPQGYNIPLDLVMQTNF